MIYLLNKVIISELTLFKFKIEKKAIHIYERILLIKMELKNKIYREWKFWYKLICGIVLILTIIFAGWLNGILDMDYIINATKIKDKVAQKGANFSSAFLTGEALDTAINNYKKDWGDYSLNFFAFFTVQSNLAIAIWFLYAAIAHKKEGKTKLLGNTTVLLLATYIGITAIVYNTMILPFSDVKDAVRWFFNIITHMLMPVLYIIYVIFFFHREEKLVDTKLFVKKQLPLFYIYPAVWSVITVIRGIFRHKASKLFQFPYFFIDFYHDHYGIKGAIWFVIGAIALVSLTTALPLLLRTFINLNEKRIN